MIYSFTYYPYIAIIGDIKNSKQIADRKNIQDKMKSILIEINRKYEQDISAKFMLTLGDEFQGLLCKGENVVYIIEEIQNKIYPVEIRFGIGIGAITTDINADMPFEADGPGYYKARSAIDFLKQNERRNKSYITDIRIEIDEDQFLQVKPLNTIFSLLTIIKKQWTTRQREIIWDFMRYQDNQEKCAKRLGITQSSVQRSLTSGNYYAYKSAIDTISYMLKEIGGEDV